MTALPPRKVFTVEEYHKMIDAGVFSGNPNFELIEGEIVKKMVQGDLHISCVNRLNMLLAPKLAGKAIVSVQNAVVISEISEPEPDIALLKFREDFYASGKAEAEAALLFIEVSDSTLKYDREIKVRLYAEAGIAEVWIVNLPKKVLEVYTDPKNGKYKTITKYDKTKSVSPKSLPKIKLKVTDIIG